MTLAELIAAVRRELNEPVEGFWTNAEIKQHLNRAHAELVELAQVQGPPYAFDLIPGQDSYALPTDFLTARRVEVDGYKMLPGTVDSREDRTGFPSSYYILAGSLYFTPTPSRSYPAKVYYYRTANVLSNDLDVPILDSRWHDLLWKYAVAMCKRRDDDPGFASYLAEYREGRAEVRARALDLGADRFRMVEDVEI